MTSFAEEFNAQPLRTRIVGRTIHFLDTVPSTNDAAWDRAKAGDDEGTVVFAEEQTRGRGRLGRTWWSPRGKGLWLSVLLRPADREGAVPATTIIGALAAAEAIRAETRLRALIRWPNDILVDDLKVGGILVEARAGRRELVLGIGIDVGSWQGSRVPKDVAVVATNLSDAADTPVDRAAFARALLRRLDRWHAVQLDRDYESINQKWKELSATLGRQITLEENGRTFEGTVIDVDVRFGLAMRLPRGAIRQFRAEHLTILRHE